MVQGSYSVITVANNQCFTLVEADLIQDIEDDDDTEEDQSEEDLDEQTEFSEVASRDT